MFEPFTDRARTVMALAHQEAQRLHHDYIGTEHIVLGLLREGTGVAAAVLHHVGVRLESARAKVEQMRGHGPTIAMHHRLPHTPRARRVIEHALEESQKLDHTYVGTEHLLLGLLLETDGAGAQVLVSLGLSLDAARAHVLALIHAGVETSEQYASETSAAINAITASASGDRSPPSVEVLGWLFDELIRGMDAQKQLLAEAQDYEGAAEAKDLVEELESLRAKFRAMPWAQ